MAEPMPPFELELSDILDGISDGLFALDAGWRVVALNRAAEAIAGRARATVIGASFWDALPDVAGSALAAQLQRAAAAGHELEFESFIAAWDRWFRVRARPLPAGLLVFMLDVTAQKRLQSASRASAIESALRASEEKFARAFSASPLILTITVLETGRFIEVNDSFVAATGWTRAEAIGRTPVELGLWEEPEQREAGLALLRAGHPLRNLEARFRVRSGEERYALLAADIVRLGEQLCVLTALTDITERKRAELALARYRLLADQTRDIVLFMRPDGRIVDANAAAVLAYGYDRQTLVSLTIHDLRDPSTEPELPEQLVEADTHGIRFETLHRRKDGTPFPVEVSSLGADVGGERLLLSIIRDITIRREMELALRHSEERLVLAQQAGGIGTFEWFIQEDRLLWTSELEALYGLPPGGFEGRHEDWLRRVHPDDRAAVEETLRETLRGGPESTPFTMEFRAVLPDGRIRWLLARSDVHHDAAGAPVRMVGVNIDITARHRVEEERDAFLASLTHDLRNPLTALQATTQLVQRQLRRREPDAVDRALSGLASIEGAAKRMGRMIDEVLDLAHLHSGQPLELRREPVDLVALVRQAVANAIEGASGRTITVEAAEQALGGEWDRARLERVIANLLANALKYSPETASVGISLVRERDAGGARARISVRDHGLGIPAEDQPRIFERYYRASNVVGRIPGSGIGLAGVKQIVEQHGGSVALESTEGEGSTFTVWLPLE